MRWILPLARRPLALGAAALIVTAAAGAATATAATHPGSAGHARRVPAAVIAGQVTAGQASAGQAGRDAASASDAAKVANPITLDPPIQVPPVKPVVVTIASHAAFGNAPPPATSTVALPRGRWAEVVLDVSGTESGVQYDRLCEVFDGPSQIFLGVTPEPTPAGIAWHVQKDVTGYLPLLRGTRTFSTFVDNYTNASDTGIPVITAKLLFYPAGRGFFPAQPASPAMPALAGDAIGQTGPAAPAQRPTVPTQVVPILPVRLYHSAEHAPFIPFLSIRLHDPSHHVIPFHSASIPFHSIPFHSAIPFHSIPFRQHAEHAGQSLSATATLPTNVTTATLDLYAVGQSTDEFWWSLAPAFREIEVSIDGKPAGVVWPYPYVYTGGVNPLIWQPLTGVHTMDIPSYRLDLSPFAGMLGGTHTITLTVANNSGYWLAGGSLMLTSGGQPTTGTVTTDTLTFPTSSHLVTRNALGSAAKPVTSESASASYDIAGQITQGGRTWTDTLAQRLQYGNDQSLIDPTCSGPCYQWVHAEVTQSASETVSGPRLSVRRDNSASWTIDAPNGYLHNAAGSAFFLPAAVSQQLTDSGTQRGGFLPPFTDSISEAIMGYGALDVNGAAVPIADGDTTGTVTEQSPGWGPGAFYQRTVVTHGGAVVENLVQP